MKCLTSNSAVLNSRRIFGLSDHHSSACRLACGFFETGYEISYRFANTISPMATCKGTRMMKEGLRSSVNAKCAIRSLASYASIYDCQWRPCHRGSLGRGMSTQVSGGMNGAAATDVKESQQRSTFAPRTRIRQIKVIPTYI
jgi:hypothetical protein